MGFSAEKGSLIEHIQKHPEGIDLATLLEFAQESGFSNLDLLLTEAVEKDGMITFDGEKYYPVVKN